MSGESQARVQELEEQAAELQEQGRFAQAVGLAEEVAAIRARVQGEDHWETVESRQTVETLGRIAGLPVDAQAEMLTVLDLDAEILRLYQHGRYADAIPVLERALDTRRRHLGTEDIDVAATASNLASLLAESGKLSDAEPLYRAALMTYRKLLGQEHPRVAKCLRHLAGLYCAKGDFSEAERLYGTALAMQRELLGEEHRDVAVSLNNIATLLHDKGDYVVAETRYRETLAMLRRLQGDEHEDVATVLSNLGTLLHEKGDYVAAEPLYREALSMERKLLGDQHPASVTSLANLAVLLASKGEYAVAEPLTREALEMRRNLLGNEHPDVAGSLNNLALLLRTKGDYAAAEPLYREALAIQRRRLGAENPSVALIMHNLAELLLVSGDYAAAEPLLRDALAIRRKRLGDGHPGVAATRNSLAALLGRRGEHAEAESLFREVLTTICTLLGDKHPNVVRTLDSLALLHYAKGEYKAAEAVWTSAAENFETARLRVSAAGLERVQFAAERSPLLALAACLARNGKPTAAWQHFEANLSRGLLDAVSARQTRPLGVEEREHEESLIGQLGKLDERIAALASNEGNEQARALADKLRRERHDLEARFVKFEQELTVKYGVPAGQTYALAHIQTLLPADTVLLAWVDIIGRPKDADASGEHWACVVRHHGDPVWAKLAGSGEGSAWTEDDDKLPGRVREALGRRPNGDAAEWQELSRCLHAQRLAPVEPHLSSIEHLIVLPAGWMAGVPVEALTDKYTVSYAPSGTMYAWLVEQRQRGEGRLLALGDPVFAQPEARAKPTPEPPDHGVLIAMVGPDTNAARSGLQRGDVLLSYDQQELAGPNDLGPAIQRAQGAAATRGEAGILVTVWREGEMLQLAVAPGRLGVNIRRDPAPEALRAQQRLDAALASTRGESFLPLPGTRREVRAIAKLFEAAEDVPRPTLLLGTDANEEQLDRLASSGELGKFRYLHLATHGKMDDEVAMRSALILSQDPAEGEREALERVLAGQEVYDGRLTAEQIVRTWKLDAELVTLSACETALGKASGGEGFLGFSQALLVAGARSLVSSLWKVDDVATTLLMTRFYENLLGRFAESRTLPGDAFSPGSPMPNAEALREAKQWLRGLTTEQVRRFCAAHDLALPSALARGEPGPMRPVKPPECPFEHPYFWSAFILMGDPGQAVSSLQ